MLVAAGQVLLDPLVSDVLPLSEWQVAFERTGRADGLKLMLDPRMDAARSTGVTREEGLAA
jgi:hypothetical protein